MKLEEQITVGLSNLKTRIFHHDGLAARIAPEITHVLADEYSQKVLADHPKLVMELMARQKSSAVDFMATRETNLLTAHTISFSATRTLESGLDYLYLLVKVEHEKTPNRSKLVVLDVAMGHGAEMTEQGIFTIDEAQDIGGWYDQQSKIEGINLLTLSSPAAALYPHQSMPTESALSRTAVTLQAAEAAYPAKNPRTPTNRWGR